LGLLLLGEIILKRAGAGYEYRLFFGVLYLLINLFLMEYFRNGKKDKKEEGQYNSQAFNGG
jgi:hypothetical protein